MSLLRHHTVLLEQSTPSTAPLLGAAYRIRPNDGDLLQDHRQRWWLHVDVARDGDGAVDVVASTSFDGALWYPIATISTKRSATVVEFVELESFAPLLRVQTLGGDVLPPHRLIARLASNGPFIATPG